MRGNRLGARGPDTPYPPLVTLRSPPGGLLSRHDFEFQASRRGSVWRTIGRARDLAAFRALRGRVPRPQQVRTGLDRHRQEWPLVAPRRGFVTRPVTRSPARAAELGAARRALVAVSHGRRKWPAAHRPYFERAAGSGRDFSGPAWADGRRRYDSRSARAVRFAVRGCRRAGFRRGHGQGRDETALAAGGLARVALPDPAPK